MYQITARVPDDLAKALDEAAASSSGAAPTSFAKHWSDT